MLSLASKFSQLAEYTSMQLSVINVNMLVGAGSVYAFNCVIASLL